MKSKAQEAKKIWNRKISISVVFPVLFVMLLLIASQFFRYKAIDKAAEIAAHTSVSCPPVDVVGYHMKEYKFTHPLLLIDIMNQGDLNDNSLSSIKEGIDNMIESREESGQVTHTSVYIKHLNTGNFISINDEDRYHPASMMKLPLMMSLLRQSEMDPQLINKEILYSRTQDQRKQNFPPGEAMVPGAKYTVKELIYRMIVKSDNDAATMLHTNVLNIDIMDKLFADLELPVPDLTSLNYTLSASEYSRFMRVLYNASYLSIENADYALSLLSQSDFKDGLLKQLPPNVVVSHKFGEFGNDKEDERELHESGIIYIANDPVVITVMTRGKDVKQLSGLISEISKYVYDQMSAKGS